MKTTMSFIRILPAFALGLVACGSADKDDTSDVSFNEPASAPTTEAPPVSLTPQTIYFDFNVPVSNSDIGSLTYSDGTTSSGMFYLYLANDQWGGTDEVDNACVLIFELTPEAATLNEDYMASTLENPAWVAWDFEATTKQRRLRRRIR